MGTGKAVVKVVVFGLWHLGTVTAACLAKKGHLVVGLDTDPAVVENLNAGHAPLYEPGLDVLIAEGIASKALSFTTDLRAALRDADYLWITFDTPVDDEDRADVEYVRRQSASALRDLRAGAGVIVSSQTPVGFTRGLEDYARTHFPGKSLVFAASPENLRLGRAIQVFEAPDRIVIGTRHPGERERFAPLFTSISSRLEWMRTESAEMTKHAINAFLATSVTFANELSSICEDVGADAAEVAEGMKSESRIGPSAYVNPGAAFAGGTLARDLVFLVGLARSLDKPAHLLRGVQESNNAHKRWAHTQCLKHFGSVAGKTCALLGLTYKAGTDTLRRSSAVEFGRWVHANGGRVRAYDPMIKDLPADLQDVIALASDPETAVRDADCVLIGAAWQEQCAPVDPIVSAMKGKLVLDPNGALRARMGNPDHATYITIGRGR